MMNERLIGRKSHTHEVGELGGLFSYYVAFPWQLETHAPFDCVGQALSIPTPNATGADYNRM